VFNVVGEPESCGNHYDNSSDDSLIIIPPGQGAFERFQNLAATAIEPGPHEIDFVTMGWDPYNSQKPGDSPGRIFLQGIKDVYHAVHANPENYPGGVRVRILLGLKYYNASDYQDQRVIVLRDLADPLLKIPMSSELAREEALSPA
jgi:hypothetical protein